MKLEHCKNQSGAPGIPGHDGATMSESLPMTLPPIAPMHLGALHPVEQALVLIVAFGPFLVLFVVVYVARRRAIAEERLEQDPSQDPGQDRQTGS